MVDARYARMVVVGDRPSGSFQGEIWQTGISMVDQAQGGVVAGAVKQTLPTFPVTVIGSTGSDATWNWDLAWEGTDKITPSDCLVLANHAVTMWNALKGLVPTDSRMTQVRISAYDATGHVINGANVYSLKSPIAGTATSSGQQPAQLTITASLRTGARGAAGRGRMFLPLNGAAPSSGLISSTNRDTVGNAVKAFVEHIAQAGPLAAIVNRSKTTYSDIDDVQVGNFYDVQRRRENAKDETYTSYAPTIT